MFSEYSIHRVSVPGAGRSPQAGAAHSTSRPQAERQVYDQFQLRNAHERACRAYFTGNPNPAYLPRN